MSGFLNTNVFQKGIEQPDSEKEGVEKEALRTRIRRYLLGDDIFISYSRLDGRGYAEKLAVLLHENYRLRCYSDFRYPQFGEKLPADLIEKLKESAALVVVISPGAVQFPKNILDEIDIFKKTRRAIFVIDLNKTYRREDWDLPGCDGVPDFYDPENSKVSDVTVSSRILESIRESFKYQAQYKKQQRNSYISAVLLLASIIVGSAALITRSKALSEAKSANKERVAAIEEKDNVNEELRIAQEKLNSLNIYLFNKEKEVEGARKELKEAQVLTNTANHKLSETKANVRKKEGELTTANNHLAVKQKEIEESEIKLLGRTASVLAASRDERFNALKMAVNAVDKSRKMNPAFDDSPLEVQKGLGDAVIAMNFAKPLITNGGSVLSTKISPNRQLIFGRIDFAEKKKLWNVIWDVKNPHLFVWQREESRNEGFVTGAAFSRDGKWLFLHNQGVLELWEILRNGDRYRIEYRSELKDNVFIRSSVMAVNSDGSKIAMLSSGGIAKTIVKDGATLKTANDIPLPYRTSSIIFSAQDELMAGHPNYSMEGWPRPDPGERRGGSDQYILYNIDQKRSVTLTGKTVGSLNEVLDSGNIIITGLEYYDYGAYAFYDESKNSQFAIISPHDGKVLSTFQAYVIGKVADRWCVLNYSFPKYTAKPRSREFDIFQSKKSINFPFGDDWSKLYEGSLESYYNLLQDMPQRPVNSYPTSVEGLYEMANQMLEGYE